MLTIGLILRQITRAAIKRRPKPSLLRQADRRAVARRCAVEAEGAPGDGRLRR